MQSRTRSASTAASSAWRTSPTEQRPTPYTPSCEIAGLRAASKLLVDVAILDTLELMMSDDLTVHILTEIRDAVRGTNERVDHLRVELRAEIGELRTELRTEIGELRTELRTELVAVRDEIGEVRARLVETDLRLATQFVAMTAEHRDVYDLLQDRFDLRDRVERVEHDVAELKKRSS